MNIFYDVFAQEYVYQSDKNEFAAPERYYEIICNRDRIGENDCVERWLLKNNQIIHIRYDEDYLKHPKSISQLRDKYAKEANSELVHLISYKIPEHAYNEIKEFMENNK